MSVFSSFFAGAERGRRQMNLLQAYLGDPNARSVRPVPRPTPYAPTDERDAAIRTMLGEAASEGDSGMAAVAHVLLNRARDGRWPAQVGDVALQPYQFSAWNAGEGGNDLVRKYGPGSPEYERAGMIFDAVRSGIIPDATRGATHYYAYNMIDAPEWFAGMTPTATIGGHRFAK